MIQSTISPNGIKTSNAIQAPNIVIGTIERPVKSQGVGKGHGPRKSQDFENILCVACNRKFNKQESKRKGFVRSSNPFELLCLIRKNYSNYKGAYSGAVRECNSAIMECRKVFICSACKQSATRRSEGGGEMEVQLMPLDQLSLWMLDANAKSVDSRLTKRLIMMLAETIERNETNAYIDWSGGPAKKMIVAGYNALTSSKWSEKDTHLVKNESYLLAMHKEWLIYNGNPVVMSSIQASRKSRRLAMMPYITKKISALEATYNTKWSSAFTQLSTQVNSISPKAVGHSSFRFAD
jgi:hypothetical protein